jgi:saccharopine dehydrogenase-like NADP-dependent oxidoreductase
MKKNVLIVGAGGVAYAAAHKCAQNNDILGDICIASRTKAKCDAIIDSIKRKHSMKNASGKICSRQIDAMDIAQTVKLIKETESRIVINLAQAFVNMSLLEACIKSGAAYIDTAIHEEPDKVCENPPWYANYEWKRKPLCSKHGITAVLGAGFDPGVVNAYCALAVKHYFDRIDTIDILDVNAGSHGRYFATNFDPEINFREFKKVWAWIGGKWAMKDVHSIKTSYDFPVVGKQNVYLNGHDELHSLSKNIKAESIRFWMGFGDHYLNVFNVLKNLSLLSEKPVRTAEGIEVVPLKVLKALLPDPLSLAPDYKGKTCIGNFIRGSKAGREKEIFIYNICDHEQCYSVPPAAASILIAKGAWDARSMVNIEELDPDPFISLLDTMGLKTVVDENPLPLDIPDGALPCKDRHALRV